MKKDDGKRNLFDMTRYFSYNEYDPESPLADENGGYIVTLSEEEICRQYYPWWYEQMCNKFGKEKVDELYTVEDCITDWVVVHWAWEVRRIKEHFGVV